MTATIRDIADAAGLSATTVSHALSGRGRVAPATRERVLRIAGSLGYVANVHAQRLVLGRSRMLALQVACCPASADRVSAPLPDDRYFLELLNGAVSRAAERDYQLVLTPGDIDPGKIHPLEIDGAIIIDPTGEETLATALTARRIPIVTTGRIGRGPTTFPFVDSDHGEVARLMLDHLRAMGYARPALVAAMPNRSFVVEVIAGYERWCAEHGFRSRVVEAQVPSVEAGSNAARQLFAHADPPDAVYATYDRLALGVLLQAQREGVAVPNDLGLACCVDSDTLQLVDPHITAADLNAYRIGQEAVRMLIDLVEGADPVDSRVIVPSHVIPRSSTSRAVVSPRSRRS